MKQNDALCNDATFVGNRSIQCLDLVGPDKKTIREKYIVGEPHDCPLGSSAEMKRRGYVGIYLKSAPVRFRSHNSTVLFAKSF
jgi:hypothetical protein